MFLDVSAEQGDWSPPSLFSTSIIRSYPNGIICFEEIVKNATLSSILLQISSVCVKNRSNVGFSDLPRDTLTQRSSSSGFLHCVLHCYGRLLSSKSVVCSGCTVHQQVTSVSPLSSLFVISYQLSCLSWRLAVFSLIHDPSQLSTDNNSSERSENSSFHLSFTSEVKRR